MILSQRLETRLGPETLPLLKSHGLCSQRGQTEGRCHPGLDEPRLKFSRTGCRKWTEKEGCARVCSVPGLHGCSSSLWAFRREPEPVSPACMKATTKQVPWHPYRDLTSTGLKTQKPRTKEPVWKLVCTSLMDSRAGEGRVKKSLWAFRVYLAQATPSVTNKRQTGT